MYTLIERFGCTPEIIYTAPNGTTQLVALVYNIRTKDESIEFTPIFASQPIPLDTLTKVTKLLENK